jgi:transglutaminase-like putative cysteine protease
MSFTPAYLLDAAQRLAAIAARDSRLPELQPLAASLVDPLGWYGTVLATWSWLPTHYVAESRGDDWQPTLVTLASRSGDCEDWSIVLAALLKANGIDARIVATLYHVAVALPVPAWLGGATGWPTFRHAGRVWVFLECTLDPTQRRGLVPGAGAGLVTAHLGTPYVQIA